MRLGGRVSSSGDRKSRNGIETDCEDYDAPVVCSQFPSAEFLGAPPAATRPDVGPEQIRQERRGGRADWGCRPVFVPMCRRSQRQHNAPSDVSLSQATLWIRYTHAVPLTAAAEFMLEISFSRFAIGLEKCFHQLFVSDEGEWV